MREKIATENDFERVVGIREALYLCPVDQPDFPVTSVRDLVKGVEYMAVYGKCSHLHPGSACHVACSQ